MNKDVEERNDVYFATKQIECNIVHTVNKFGRRMCYSMYSYLKAWEEYELARRTQQHRRNRQPTLTDAQTREKKKKESKQPRFQRSFDGVRLFEREHEIQISVDMHRAANPDKFLWWENTAGINFSANPDNILWWINSAGNTP